MDLNKAGQNPWIAQQIQREPVQMTHDDFVGTKQKLSKIILQPKHQEFQYPTDPK